jgi:hypothetical protein
MEPTRRSPLLGRAWIVLPLLATSCEVKVTHSFTQSPGAKVKADICIIKEALDSYAMQHSGDYPRTLDVLVAPDEGGRRFLSQPTIPKDPWGHEYGYEPPRPGYPQPRVYTLGRDACAGGTGDDADIDYAAILEGR